MTRVARGVSSPRRDVVAREEPLEIQLDGRSLAVVMRTPGHDPELALGLLWSERVIGSLDDVVSIRHATQARDPDSCGKHLAGAPAPRAVRRLAAPATKSLCERELRSVRQGDHRSASSSDAPPLRRRIDLPPFPRYDASRAAARIADGVRGDRRAPRRRPLRSRRSPARRCARTSGATTPWTRSSAGPCAPAKLPLAGHVLLVSGRISYEIAVRRRWRRAFRSWPRCRRRPR